jgi:hypothetical protein
MSETIVDYVQIVVDADGGHRVRGKSDGNGEIIWSTEKYGDRDWALAVARDSGKPIRDVDGKSIT